LWPAFADPTQIELVILNLAINARDAMDAGGTLSITTENVTLGPGEKPEEPPFGEYVAVCVSDSGAGMTQEVRKKAFEPFFTTKELGRGSGLGLSQVLGFAKQSGGGVRLETSEGNGTTVTVYLPRARQARRSETARTAGEKAAPNTGPARILLVDDEPPVREVIASELRELGHDVIEVGSGGAALEALDRDAPFDAAILDFAMPGMNGAELARQIRARRPEICVLFVTGYADTSELSQIADELIVRKPLLGGDLTRKLQAALAGS
jgi:CheY-like chemotaxis protein